MNTRTAVIGALAALILCLIVSLIFRLAVTGTISMPGLFSRHLAEVNSFPQGMPVRVAAKQFDWHFQYPGPDGQLGRVDPSLIDEQNPMGIDGTAGRGG